jgi:2-dehydropantoate 2-reductase
MRVLCYGAGAVGSLVAGRLSETGAAVTVLARRSHVAAIRTWGLTLETPSGRVVCKKVDSVTSVDDLTAAPDLVLLSVKSYQTQDALGDLAALAKGGARILSLQNGIGNEEAIAAVAGPDRTLAGSLTISVSVVQPGVVRQNAGSGGMAIAPVGAGAVESTANAVRLFQQAGFRTDPHRNYRAMKWSKLFLNMITNASSAILDLSPRDIVRDPRLFHLEREAVLEAVRVVRSLGLRPVPLPGYPVPLLQAAIAAPEWVARAILGGRIAQSRGGKMPTLWVDLERGRRQSEVEVLNGAVAREGARLGIPTPINAMLTDALLALASGRRDRREFHRNPDALLALRAGSVPA